MTLYQFQVASCKRTSPVVPNMELPNGNECTTKPRRCCRTLANPSMVGTKPFWKDGTRITNTTSPWQTLGGLKSRLFSMTNLHWKITPKVQRVRKEIELRKVGFSSWIKKVLKDQWIKDVISLKQNEKWKDCMMNMRKRFQKEIHPFILFNDQDSEDTNNVKGLKNIIFMSMPKQDGGLALRNHRATCRRIQHICPRQLSGNSTTIGSRRKVGLIGDPHPGLNNSVFLFRDAFSFFACRKVNGV